MLWCVVGIVFNVPQLGSVAVSRSQLFLRLKIHRVTSYDPDILRPPHAATRHLTCSITLHGCLQCVFLCLSGLGVALLPEGRHHEAGLASESQHQQQPVCLHEGESSRDPAVPRCLAVLPNILPDRLTSATRRRRLKAAGFSPRLARKRDGCPLTRSPVLVNRRCSRGGTSTCRSCPTAPTS